jgi:protein gp37
MPTKIEWVINSDGSRGETINPLGWGCYGVGTKDAPQPCSYCYAARIAKTKRRKCPLCQAFIPHLHPEAMEKIYRWKKPRRIFIQSMGDLFHPAISNKIIRDIIRKIHWDNHRKGDEGHTYFFLTKNPQRYLEFDFPDNCWLGSTHTGILRLKMPGGEFYEWQILRKHHPKLFISFEPLLDEVFILFPEHIDKLGLIIIGAMTGAKAKYHRPQREWVEDLIAEADKYCIPVFLKNNILEIYPELPRRQELPWRPSSS